jgi:hypothetical protein
LRNSSTTGSVFQLIASFCHPANGGHFFVKTSDWVKAEFCSSQSALAGLAGQALAVSAPLVSGVLSRFSPQRPEKSSY